MTDATYEPYDVLEITPADVFVTAEFQHRQVAAEVECGFGDHNGDEATWWHTYALPILRLHYALADRK